MNILAEIIVTYYGTVYKHFMTTGSPNMCLWHQIISKPSSLSCLGNEKSGKAKDTFYGKNDFIRSVGIKKGAGIDMNVVMITGASSGIGMEFALQMDNYFDTIDEFWLIARSREHLEEVAKVMLHKTRIISMDITDAKKQEALEDLMIEKKAIVRVLVNAAGFGIMGPFSEQERMTAQDMIRLNCEALTLLTHRILPFMRRNSRVIQIASSAAFLPQPDFAVYAATKAYVLSFSRALGEELRDAGIYVTSVCPGPVDTPFFDIAEKTGTTLSIKKYTMVSPERVVALALKDSYHKRSMSVCSLPIKYFQCLAKTVPHELLLKATGLLKKKGF